MTSPNLTETNSTGADLSPTVKQITAYFSSLRNISVVYLFGSAVAGRQRSDSDLDIAILRDREIISPTEIFQMTLDLNNETGREIDLVDLNNVNCILQMQVLKYGRILLCRDEKTLVSFHTRTVRDYLDLKRVRKPIEDALSQVSIYG